MSHRAAILIVGALISGTPGFPSNAAAQEDYERFLGAEPEAFSTMEALAEAFKSRLAAGDKAGTLELLGLEPGAVQATEDFDERFADVHAAAAARMAIEEEAPDRRLLILGDKLWPFPFPMAMAGGKWSFDTIAGIEEVISRRIGENELQAIETSRAYVEAQRVYAETDWDDDGVLEYAQKLVSTPRAFDGLYWPAEGGAPESPAGPFVAEARLEPDPARPSGYFGYRFRILTGQGDNVAGDAYDYVINGNMIAGFALIAWPAEYGETGIKTFMISHHGTVYEKDLGDGTEQAAGAITIFNPDDAWAVATEPSG